MHVLCITLNTSASIILTFPKSMVLTAILSTGSEVSHPSVSVADSERLIAYTSALTLSISGVGFFFTLQVRWNMNSLLSTAVNDTSIGNLKRKKKNRKRERERGIMLLILVVSKRFSNK